MIVTTPEMVQGIGGRMSGLVSTSPFTEEMDRIEQGGGIVLDRAHAAIDPVRGVSLVYEKGFSHVVVTVASAKAAAAIHAQYPDVFIFGVHMSGITQADAELLVAVADIVTACASKWIWQIAGARALVQAGTAVPVFALTKRGKQSILDKIARSGRADPRVRIKTTDLWPRDSRSPTVRISLGKAGTEFLFWITLKGAQI